MGVKLFPITEESGEIYGFYIKGAPGRKQILDELLYEFPDFYQENILLLLAIKLTPCFVRIVPNHPESEMGQMGFAVTYWECERGRGAMKALKFSLAL